MGRENPRESLLVSRAEIEPMAAAAAVIADCRRELAARDRDILSEVMAREETASEWRHYPEGDVYDPKSHAQYFYHVHPVNGRPIREHGHFHTFLRAEGMPAGTVPLILPEIAVADVPALPPQAPPLKRGSREEVSHLVAIAVDCRGEPIRIDGEAEGSICICGSNRPAQLAGTSPIPPGARSFPPCCCGEGVLDGHLSAGVMRG